MTISTVDTIAALRLESPGAQSAFLCLGHTTKGDDGYGEFYWDSASTEDDDNGIVIEPSAGGTGRWKRLLPEHLTPDMFGALGDGTTDDTDAHVAWWAAMQRLGHPGFWPGKSYVLREGEMEWTHPARATTTGVTNGNPCTVTAVNDLANGNTITIHGVIGMNFVNGYSFKVANRTPTSFTLLRTDGTTAINSTSYGSYVSGGGVYTTTDDIAGPTIYTTSDTTIIAKGVADAPLISIHNSPNTTFAWVIGGYVGGIVFRDSPAGTAPNRHGIRLSGTQSIDLGLMQGYYLPGDLCHIWNRTQPDLDAPRPCLRLQPIRR